ncbi:MAG: single-stranded DNA-binding protein [Candidatus Pacebacteria bacterium]|nr:single-stranded DNA-binding protein [Candidatus Paceibacterota bacterium]
MNLNKVVLIGRLTQDPEMRSTPGGQSVTTVKLATNRVWNDQVTHQKKEATEYHTIVCWGRLGEICGQYLKKGSLAFFEGRLQTRSWDDKTSGQKRYTTEIVAENMQIGPRPAGAPYQAGAPVADVRRAPSAAPMRSAEPEIPVINEDELTVAGMDEEPKPINDADLPF